MVRNGFKHIFQRAAPDIDSSERTQQLRSKTVYSGTVDLANTLSKNNNNRYKTYNGPYEIANQEGISNVVASHSYHDLLSITKGKVLSNQLPLTSLTQAYYQENFANGQMYEGNYNHFDPSFNPLCNNSPMVYDIGATGFTGPDSYNTNGGFVGQTGPQGVEGISYNKLVGYVGTTTVVSGTQNNNNQIFIDPDHCYYSDPCLQDASYTRFVKPVLKGLTGPDEYNAQKIINADQYRGFSYPMPNLTLTCKQLVSQSSGPIFCSQDPNFKSNTLITTFPQDSYKIMYVSSDGSPSSYPFIDGFTVYQFGTPGTVPLDTVLTRDIIYMGGGPIDIHYAVVGGGGGGGSSFNFNNLTPYSSGGGGGGFFYSTFPSSSQVQLLSGVSYSITIGGGGSAGSIAGPNGQNGNNGQNSVINFNSGSTTGYGGGGGATAFTSAGGGVGTGSNGNSNQGNGGGGAGSPVSSGAGGVGTFNGGAGSNTYAGAGGGGGMAQIGGGVPGQVSKGGDGISTTISGATQYFGGGGGGGAAFLDNATNYGVGGLGGGGNGGWWNISYNLVQAQNGADVYGGGGGGAYSVLPPALSPSSVSGANGGSGSVWIRFKSYTKKN